LKRSFGWGEKKFKEVREGKGEEIVVERSVKLGLGSATIRKTLCAGKKGERGGGGSLMRGEGSFRTGGNGFFWSLSAVVGRRPIAS